MNPETVSLADALRRRRSVRGFLDKPVPEAVLKEVFELAQLAPSNCNIQPSFPAFSSTHCWYFSGCKVLKMAIRRASLVRELFLNAGACSEDLDGFFHITLFSGV